MMTETLIADTELHSAVLLAVFCSSHGLVFEANQTRLQVFSGRVYGAPSDNPLLVGLSNLEGNVEPVYQLVSAQRSGSARAAVAPLLRVACGERKITLLLDAHPWVPGRLKPSLLPPPAALSPFAVQCYEEVGAGDTARQIWSVVTESLIDSLIGQIPT
jgi:hypothetical protein